MKEVWNKYKKAIVATLGVVLSAALAALTGNASIDLNEWSNIVVLGTGAFSVAVAPNVPGFKYVKAICAAGAAVATLLVSLYTGGLTSPEIWQLVVAGMTAAGVYQFGNKGDYLDRSNNVNVF